MRRILPVLILLFLASETCLAGIRLRIRPASSYMKGACHIGVQVTNTGNEPARNLLVKASIGNARTAGEEKDELLPGNSIDCRLEPLPPPAPPGIHTTIIEVFYSDINGHKYSACSPITIVTAIPETEEDPVTANLSSIIMKKKDRLTLDIRKMEGGPESVTARLVTPFNLNCANSQQKIPLTTAAGNVAVFDIENSSALPGSRHGIFAVIDYTVNGLHRSISVPARVTIKQLWQPPALNTIWAAALVFLLIGAALVMGRVLKGKPPAPESVRRMETTVTVSILLLLLIFTAIYIPPSLLFQDTITTGGDTPAHNYLASHLKDSLFYSGRIVSWASGWWCGFPAFQYYFCLPYLLTALLSVIIPFNIAFKIVSVIGIFLTPLCAWGCARLMRMKRPAPVLFAAATLPFIFVGNHTMWGLNVKSTLAGMISAGLSFPFLLLFIGSAWRDMEDRSFRIRTSLLLCLVISSHFFSSIIAVISIVVLPFLRPRKDTPRALGIIVTEGLLAFLLMAWWLVPLVAKSKWSVDFGVNWIMPGLERFDHFPWFGFLLLPHYVFLLFPFAVYAVVKAYRERINYIAVFLSMLVFSLLLFYFGYNHVSEVFVNVRLWPFIFFSVFALEVCGIGFLVQRVRVTWPVTAALTVCALSFCVRNPAEVLNWARWNYSGMEGKQGWPVFEKLLLPLKDTPGRFANDLHAANKGAFGSTRAMEALPHVIEKPVLEGGIVNSALGSMFSYYIQGETSRLCAGFPKIVKPATFNITNATRHLELCNVKHFLARWEGTKQALGKSDDWKLIGEERDWQLYELLTCDGSYVFIPEHDPAPVESDFSSDRFKKDLLEWIYRPAALEYPFVICPPGDKTLSQKKLSGTEYRDLLESLAEGGNPAGKRDFKKLNTGSVRITEEEITSSRIRFTTTGTGLPHIIKYTYFPNWKVRGADRVHLVTPGFMLVYPTSDKVELYYGYTVSDNIGRVLTAIGCIVTALILVRLRSKKPLPANP